MCSVTKVECTMIVIYIHVWISAHWWLLQTSSNYNLLDITNVIFLSYDSDNPRVHGDVGMAGVAVDSVEDMKVCLIFFNA